MSAFALVILRRPWVFAFSFTLLFAPRVKDNPSRVSAAEPVGHVRLARAELLLSFEPNLGQADPPVKFFSRGQGYTLFLTKDEAALVLQKPEVRSQKSVKEGRQLSVVRGQLPETSGGIRSGSLVLPRPSEPFPSRSPHPQPPSFLDLKLLGANPAAKVTGANELPGKSNYLIGNDPKKWRTNVPTYGRVRYENIYPGVDLVYYGKQGGQLEYDFVIAPGADASAITLAIDAEGQVSSRQKAVGSGQSSVVSRQRSEVGHNHPGTGDKVGNSGHLIPQFKMQNRKSKIASSLRIAANGDLVVTAEGGEVRFHKPVVYQKESTVESRQSRVESRPRTTDHGQLTSTNPESEIQNPKLIEGRYILKSDGEVTFEIAPYDRTLPLIIDPVLSYSTYLGGSDMDYANGIAVDPSGNAYVTGYTASTDFPLVNPAQSSPGGGTCSDGADAVACFDAFVAKLNPTGTALVYSTYLGGSNEDYGTGIALDASGDAYVTGYTNSTDFPVQHALQSENAGGYDAFVAELSADGASLIYSTYCGGSLDDIGTGIAVDSSGNAYISGYTASPDFPVTSGALHANYGGGVHNGFVAKFNSGGAELGYSTFLGGSADDYAYGVAVDSAGDAYVTGATNSTNFPTANAFQPHYAGGLCATAPNTFPCYDAFVAKLNPAGSALIFSTYLGGTGSDYGYAIALDSSSNAYITGYTTSTNFPTTAGAFQRVFGGSYDAFVAKLNGAGSTLGYSTYLGGSGTEVGYGIAVDSTGSAFLTGYNYGGYFPTANPLQAQNAGFYDAFVSVLDPTGSSLIFSTYLGGTYDDFGRGISLDPSGNAYVAGATFSLDFPTTSGSFQPSYGGGPYDAFVTKYNVPTVPLVALSPSSYDFGSQVVGTTSSPETIALTNNGNAALTISSITVSGDFSQTNACGSSLAASASCTISVTFTPTATGSRNGSITITDNASPATQTVSLTGTGTGTVVSLSPASLTFPAQQVGTSSSAQSVTLTNTGTTTLSITSIIASGDFIQTNTCGSSLAASASCTLSVTFNPTAGGTRTGAVTITDSAVGSPQTVTLTGTGEDFIFTAASGSSTSATVSPGGTATYTLSIVALGGFNQNATFTCTGAPSEARCTVSPASVTLSSSSTNVTVTVSTTAPSLGVPRCSPLAPIRPARPQPWLLWTMALVASGCSAWAIQGLVHPGMGRSRPGFVSFAALLLVMLAMAACGGGGGGSAAVSPASSSGTPPGTYTLTATGTCLSGSTSLSHSVNLTLQVE